MSESSVILLRAAAQARELRGQVLVIKLGGSAMEEPVATRGMVAAISALNALGIAIVVVHGGGKPIDRAMATAGIEPVKIEGLRVTDDATLEIVIRVLHQIGANLATLFQTVGEKTHVFRVDELFPLVGERLLLPGLDLQPVDLGHVGTVTKVMKLVLKFSLEDHSIAILPSLATMGDDGVLNVNADSAAGAVAGALKSPACLFLTDTPGILRDRRDSTSRIAKLTVGECRDLISSGVIDGGMIPKVDACFDALTAGAGSAIILDGRDPQALLNWFLGEPGGTEIVP